MSELLQVALDHHLYLFPVAAGVMWLLTRWGAQPKSKKKEKNQQ